MMLNEPTDPQFPHIRFALDMTAMREALQNGLLAQTGRGDRLFIETCRMSEQRYKPGKSYVLSYRLRILDADTQSVREQIVGARLCKPGQGLAEFERASRNELVAQDGVRPVAYLPEAEIVVWSFPNDRKLAHLPQMVDLPFLYDRLPQRLVSLGHAFTRVNRIKTGVVHYLPERSCMIRYELELEDLNTGDVVPQVLFGKIYPDESGCGVYDVMSQLSNQAEALRIAKPMGYDPELRV